MVSRLRLNDAFMLVVRFSLEGPFGASVDRACCITDRCRVSDGTEHLDDVVQYLCIDLVRTCEDFD